MLTKQSLIKQLFETEFEVFITLKDTVSACTVPHSVMPAGIISSLKTDLSAFVLCKICQLFFPLGSTCSVPGFHVINLVLEKLI